MAIFQQGTPQYFVDVREAWCTITVLQQSRMIERMEISRAQAPQVAQALDPERTAREAEKDALLRMCRNQFNRMLERNHVAAVDLQYVKSLIGQIATLAPGEGA